MSELNIQQTFQIAVGHHQAGRLQQAENLYRQILAQQPKHFEAMHHLGVIAHQQGRHDVAMELIRQALSLQPGNAHAHNNLGLVLKALGQLDEAILAYRQSIVLMPRSPGAYYNLGAALNDKGQTGEAIEAYGQAIALSPGYPEAFNGLGIALADSGQVDEAIRAFRRAISLNPNVLKVHHNLGKALRKRSKLDEPASVPRQVSALGSDSRAGDQNLTKELRRAAQLDEAIAAERRAIALEPDYLEAYINLSAALRDKGQYDEAIVACRQAISLKPDCPQAHNQLGMALRKKEQFDEAIAAFRQAIALKPNYAEAQGNLGTALSFLRQFEEAIAALRQVIALKPDSAPAHYNLALVLLLQDDYVEGWKEYEWRWNLSPSAPAWRAFSQPQWHGEPLEGKRILLHAEQGFGDTLVAVRYVPLVLQRGGHVILKCERDLLRLLRALPGVEQLITSGESIPSFDVHCPLMSLPLALGTRPDNIPANVPYLTADPELVRAWEARLRLNRNRKNVGLVWSGGIWPNNQTDRRKSMSLSKFAPLAQVKNVRFYSLQKGKPAAEAAHPPNGMELIDVAEQLTDFADTAAVVANLDLVITVDTSMANLVGAMGRADWVLLPFMSDWRWTTDRDRAPWYPTMRLFRQNQPGDWPEVMERVARQLTSFAARGEF